MISRQWIRHFSGWMAGVMLFDPASAVALGLRSESVTALSRSLPTSAVFQRQAFELPSIWQRLSNLYFSGGRRIRQESSAVAMNHPIRIGQPGTSRIRIPFVLVRGDTPGTVPVRIHVSPEHAGLQNHPFIDYFLPRAFARAIQQWPWDGLSENQIEALLDYMNKEGALVLSGTHSAISHYHQRQVVFHLEWVKSGGFPDPGSPDGAAFQALIDDMVLHETRHLLTDLSRRSKSDPRLKIFASLPRVVGRPISAVAEEEAVLDYMEHYYFLHPTAADRLNECLFQSEYPWNRAWTTVEWFRGRLLRAMRGESRPGRRRIWEKTFRLTPARVLSEIEAAVRYEPGAAPLTDLLRRFWIVAPEASREDIQRGLHGLLKILPPDSAEVKMLERFKILDAIQPHLDSMPEAVDYLFWMTKDLGHLAIPDPIATQLFVSSLQRLRHRAQEHRLQTIAGHVAGFLMVQIESDFAASVSEENRLLLADFIPDPHNIPDAGARQQAVNAGILLGLLRSSLQTVPQHIVRQAAHWVPLLWPYREEDEVAQSIALIAEAVASQTQKDAAVFETLLPIALLCTDLEQHPEGLEESLVEPVEWILKATTVAAPGPDALWTLTARSLPFVPEAERILIKQTNDRMVRSTRHLAAGTFFPRSYKAIFEALPTGAAQQAAMIAGYLYHHGVLSTKELQQELMQLLVWERNARKRFGADFLVGQEFHSGIPESVRGQQIQRVLEFFMHVPRNLNARGRLRISTQFEDGGLEYQMLPSASGEVQSQIWILWEKLAALEHFDLYDKDNFVLYDKPDTASPQSIKDYWVHFNFNGQLSADALSRVPLLWGKINAQLTRDLGLPPSWGVSEAYTHWDVRPPRESALGGWRTEVTGTLWQGIPDDDQRQVFLTYRHELILALTEAVWAAQHRQDNLVAEQLWDRLMENVPPSPVMAHGPYRIVPIATLVATQLYYALLTDSTFPVMPTYQRGRWEIYDLLTSWWSLVDRIHSSYSSSREVRAQAGQNLVPLAQTLMRALAEALMQRGLWEDPFVQKLESLAERPMQDFFNGSVAAEWLPLLVKSLGEGEGPSTPGNEGVSGVSKQTGSVLTEVLAGLGALSGMSLMFWTHPFLLPLSAAIGLAWLFIAHNPFKPRPSPPAVSRPIQIAA